MFRALILLGLLLSLTEGLLGQYPGEFSEFSYPRQAEIVRLGGMYTAVGRGIAAVEQNPASLAFQENVQATFSNGFNNDNFQTELTSAWSSAVMLFVPAWQTSVALSHHAYATEYDGWGVESEYIQRSKWDVRLTSLHLAHRINNILAAALSVHRYDVSAEATSGRERLDVTNSCWDVSLSFAGRTSLPVIADHDELRFGVALDNVHSTNFELQDDDRYARPLHQSLRFAVAYLCDPEFSDVWPLDPVAFLVTAQGAVHGADYSFDVWGEYGVAGELRLLEVLLLSAGISDRDFLSFGDDDPAFPVFRWGLGIDIPLHRLFWKGAEPWSLQFDYARTQWSKDLLSDWRWRHEKENTRPLWSLQLRAQLF